MTDAVEHDPKITRLSGPYYRFVCACGTRTPLMGRQGAQLAMDRHKEEHHLDVEVEL